MIENIKKLEHLENNRSGHNGYLTGKITINYDKMRFVTLNGNYDNLKYDQFIIQAIRENEQLLLIRAKEIEEQYYHEIKLKAKQEAANLLAGEDIIK